MLEIITVRKLGNLISQSLLPSWSCRMPILWRCGLIISRSCQMNPYRTRSRPMILWILQEAPDLSRSIHKACHTISHHLKPFNNSIYIYILYRTTSLKPTYPYPKLLPPKKKHKNVLETTSNRRISKKTYKTPINTIQTPYKSLVSGVASVATRPLQWCPLWPPRWGPPARWGSPGETFGDGKSLWIYNGYMVNNKWLS